jgi:hypothetical protein
MFIESNFYAAIIVNAGYTVERDMVMVRQYNGEVKE